MGGAAWVGIGGGLAAVGGLAPGPVTLHGQRDGWMSSKNIGFERDVSSLSMPLLAKLASVAEPTKMNPPPLPPPPLAHAGKALPEESVCPSEG